MNSKGLGVLSGLGLGAGLVYLFDPDKGKRRRTVAGDKVKRFWRITERAVEKTSRDLSNRARGLLAELHTDSKEEVSDEVLVDRVRSAMGHTVSNTRAIQVTSEQGRVTLVGSAPKDEISQLLACVSAVRGVSEVRNRLSVQEHVHPGAVERAANRSWLKPLLWSFAGGLAIYGGSSPGHRKQIMRILGI